MYMITVHDTNAPHHTRLSYDTREDADSARGYYRAQGYEVSEPEPEDRLTALAWAVNNVTQNNNRYD